MANALLIVPPFIKYSAGPLLGPALLTSAARNHGHHCENIDLNAMFIRSQRPVRTHARGSFVGDHDKPRPFMGDGQHCLSRLEESFLTNVILPSLDLGSNETDAMRRFLFGFLDHDQAKGSADRLVASAFGSWIRDTLCQLPPRNAPHVVGVSLLHAGQVIPAIVTSMIARQVWPRAIIAWGGPHVSGIGSAIKQDINRYAYAADLFVTGHAEESLVDLLNQCARGELSRNSQPDVISGVRGGSVAPCFSNLNLYDDPSVLPAQSTLGCAYGRCAFCTYPSMEPTPTKLDLCIAIDSVANTAQSIKATMAIKDSLVSPKRLLEIGDTIAGRAKWSACTKLNPKLDSELLERLALNGLATLEVGLESLLAETQSRVAKVHPPKLYEGFLDSVSDVPEVSVVVNYMTGFPWEDPLAAHVKRKQAEGLLAQYLGSRGKLEHNQFELERLSPMAMNPEHFGIDAKSLKRWPWASVIEYSPSTRRQLESERAL